MKEQNNRILRANFTCLPYLCGLLLLIIAEGVFAEGPTKISWMKSCGYSDWSHSKWVIGLDDGKVLWGFYNPAQGRSATFSMILAAYTSGKNVYYEGYRNTPEVVCGVSNAFLLDPGPSSGGTPNATFMISDN